MKTCASLDEAAALLAHHARGGRVYLSAGPAEPLALTEAFRRDPDKAAGLSFAGLFIPGINRMDYAALHPTARMEMFMLSADWRGGFERRQSVLRPLHYSRAYAALVTEGADAGVFHVSPANAAGAHSFGLCADLPPDMLSRCGFRLGVINHAMPFVAGAPSVRTDAFDTVVEVDHPLATLAPVSPSGAEAIAAHVAALVRDGDTIQMGVGKLPAAVTAALRDRRGLRVHSGLIATSHFALLDAGALADGAGVLTGGVVAGEADTYARAAREPRLRLVNVPGTHGQDALAAIQNLVAVNAALEADLFGQVNAELAAGRQISGVGGLVDFIRGARASRGGRPIVMLQAEGRDGASRIVARLERPPTVPRTDAPILVTEFGAVDLGPLALDERAEAVIGLAPPAARAGLQADWARMRAAM